MTRPLSATRAAAVWQVLVDHAGASDEEYASRQFAYHLTHGCTEYRFMGSLGFGGKLYVEARRWRVGCYREDDTPERRAVIDATNAALDELRAAHEQEASA